MRYRIPLLVLWMFMAPSAMAQLLPAVREAAMSQVPPGTDSEKAHILSLLIKGDIEGAISYWQIANVGRQTPAWLLALKTSYEAGKQTAGKCQEVARNIHTAFTQLGGLAAGGAGSSGAAAARIQSGSSLGGSGAGFSAGAGRDRTHSGSSGLGSAL